jgi:DNA-binding HxlR family transcriptional regulator
VVGDRWTLLLVRELLTGPKRHTDLRAGLPGIATNVLGDRLQLLQRAGPVRRATLPPPAASTVYELTDRGRQLKPVLLALAGWGLPLLGSPRTQDAYRDVFLAWGTGQLSDEQALAAGLRVTPGPEALQQLRRLFPNRLPAEAAS